LAETKGKNERHNRNQNRGLHFLAAAIRRLKISSHWQKKGTPIIVCTWRRQYCNRMAEKTEHQYAVHTRRTCHGPCLPLEVATAILAGLVNKELTAAINTQGR